MPPAVTQEQKAWPIFLKRTDLPAFSGLSMDAIRKVLDEKGVKPVDIGGHHYGLRWYRDAVIEALGTLHAEAQAAPAKPKPARRRRKIAGKTPMQLMEELAAGKKEP